MWAFIFVFVFLQSVAQAQITSFVPATKQAAQQPSNSQCNCTRYPFPPGCTKECSTCTGRVEHISATTIVIVDCRGQRHTFGIRSQGKKLDSGTEHKVRTLYKLDKRKRVITGLILKNKKGTIVLVRVPDLENMSQAEAERQLSEAGLKSAVRPQVHPRTPKGRVIRGSLDPAAGTLVEPETVVHFGVSTMDVAPSTTCRANLTISKPNRVAPLRCEVAPEGYGLCEVAGTVNHISGKCAIALWVRLVRPQAGRFVWYFQRGGAGHVELKPDNSWDGTVQVGDTVYIPHRGDVVDISASIVDRDALDELLAMPGIIAEEPVGQHVSVRARLILK